MTVIDEIRRREQLVKDLRLRLLTAETRAEADEIERAVREALKKADDIRKEKTKA